MNALLTWANTRDFGANLGYGYLARFHTASYEAIALRIRGDAFISTRNSGYYTIKHVEIQA